MNKIQEVKAKILQFIAESGGKVRIGATALFAKKFDCNIGLISRVLRKLLKDGKIRKTASAKKRIGQPVEYVLVSCVAANEISTPTPTKGDSSTATGDFFQKALELLATLKNTQERLIAALDRIKQLEEEVANQKEEQDRTDNQLFASQRRLLDLVASTSENDRIISKQVAFDGRGVQITVSPGE